MPAREVRAAAAMAASGLLLGAGVPFALGAAVGAVRGTGGASGLIRSVACWTACALLVLWASRLRGRTPWTLGLEILWLAAAVAGFAGARMLTGGG